MYEFTYERPKSVPAALKALQKSKDAKYLAGGMSLIPTLKLRLAEVSELVDLSDLKTFDRYIVGVG